MQLHELISTTKNKSQKRIGRGGKRGTYSGKGMKGQKSRAGASQRADFRGGDAPLWKLFPKKRGARKKTEKKHRFFAIKHEKPEILNLDKINKIFNDGDIVSPATLLKKGALKSAKKGIKILGNGQLLKKVEIKDVELSESARSKIIKAGGKIS